MDDTALNDITHVLSQECMDVEEKKGKGKCLNQATMIVGLPCEGG